MNKFGRRTTQQQGTNQLEKTIEGRKTSKVKVYFDDRYCGGRQRTTHNAQHPRSRSKSKSNSGTRDRETGKKLPVWW
jgi:hypothetical protein